MWQPDGVMDGSALIHLDVDESYPGDHWPHAYHDML